jgi:hypothetical protein
MEDRAKGAGVAVTAVTRNQKFFDRCIPQIAELSLNDITHLERAD